MRVPSDSLMDLLFLAPHELRKLLRRERDVARHVDAHGKVGKVGKVGKATLPPLGRDTRMPARGGGCTDLRIRVGE
ncbi:hypothetical protein [Streptomyces niveus]